MSLNANQDNFMAIWCVSIQVLSSFSKYTYILKVCTFPSQVGEQQGQKHQYAKNKKMNSLQMLQYDDSQALETNSVNGYRWVVCQLMVLGCLHL